MTGPRDPDMRGRADRDRERDLEGDLERYLAAGPDSAPPSIAESAADRTSRMTQRPGWLARLMAPDAPAGRSGLVRAAIVAVVVLSGVLVGLQAGLLDLGPGPGSSPSPDASSSPTAGISQSPLPHLSDQVTATYPLGDESKALAAVAAFDSVWVGGADVLTRLDPASGEVIGVIEFPGTGCGPVVATAQSIWFGACGDGPSAGYDQRTTLRFEPVAMTLANAYDDGAPDGIGVASLGGGAWFISDVGAGTLTKIDESTGAIVATLELGQSVHFLTAGFGSLWVSPLGMDLAEVWRVDPETGEILATVTLSGDAGQLEVSADAIWVAEPHQWLLGRIDPATDRVVAEWGIGPGTDQIVLDDGRVWAVAESEMVAIDMETADEVARWRVPSHSWLEVGTHPLAAGFGSLWWAQDGDLFRVEP